MKVRFISGPKINTTEHVANDIGRTLVAAGLAEHVPYKDFRERLAAESSPAAKPTPVEWGIRESDGSPFSVTVVVKKTATGMQFLSQPPDDAPESIKRRFAELASINPNAAAEALGARKREQAEYDERMKMAKRF